MGNDAPVWTLEEGLKVVRALQPHTRAFNYHLAIGGGVVNNGQSDKDLDLYFISFDQKDGIDAAGLLALLDVTFGPHEDIAPTEYPTIIYRYKVKFENNGKRIDAFIL